MAHNLIQAILQKLSNSAHPKNATTLRFTTYDLCSISSIADLYPISPHQYFLPVVKSLMSSGAKWLGLSIFIFHSKMVVLECVISYYLVVLERVNLILLIKAIGQAAIILERIKSWIVWSHGATLKRDEVLGLLDLNLDVISASVEANRLNAWLLRTQLGLGPLADSGSYIALQDLCSQEYQL